LAEGRISIEEAKLKEAELYYDSIADLMKTKNIDLTEAKKIQDMIDSQLGFRYDEVNNRYVNSEGKPLSADEALSRARFLEEQLQNYTDPLDLQKNIRERIQSRTGGDNGNNNDGIPEGSKIKISKSGGILSMISEEYED